MTLQEAVSIYQRCQDRKFWSFRSPTCDNCPLTAKVTEDEYSPTICDALDVISEIRQEVKA